jgi:hypothetical protein
MSEDITREMVEPTDGTIFTPPESSPFTMPETPVFTAPETPIFTKSKLDALFPTGPMPRQF